MIKLLFRLFAILTCVLITSNNTSAGSIAISNMTLLSTKSFLSDQRRLMKHSLFEKQEQECMALAIYHEARGEPSIGQYAVCATILNRVKSRAYPDTICRVVFQNEHMKHRCQFSFACDGISDIPRNKASYIKMLRLSKLLLKSGMARQAKFIGHDFYSSVDAMTHYHRHDVNPSWSKHLDKISRLGAHVFFKSNRVTKLYPY